MHQPRFALLVAALAAGACSEAPRSPDPRLWTVFDLAPRAGDPMAAAAADAGLPGGVPVNQIVASDGKTLVVRDALDLYLAAYVTTEVWAHYDRVWVQPMYVLVTDGPDGQPVPLRRPVEPIFSVGPASGFYSPFWQTFYVHVPPDTEPETLTSVRAIQGSGFPLTAGPGRTIPLVPDGTAVDPNGTAAVKPIGAPRAGQGWLDGARVSFLDFGAGLFTWDEAGVVAERPLYHFVFPGPDDKVTALDVPAVAPPGLPGQSAEKPPDLGGPLLYASYWRLYTVRVPATARVFAPPAQTALLRPGLVEALGASGFPVVPEADYSMDVATSPDVPAYLGHVALDWTCFSSSPLDVEACTWLDSQEAIEDRLDPTAVEPTAITVTCPLVSVKGKALSPGDW